MPESMFNTIRAEIRAVVDEAKRVGRPVTDEIVWGLLEREVPEDSFRSTLWSMVGRHQITKVDLPDGRTGFEPGPVGVKDAKRRERHTRAMGFMAHKRLVEARAAARKWRACG